MSSPLTFISQPPQAFFVGNYPKSFKSQRISPSFNGFNFSFHPHVDIYHQYDAFSARPRLPSFSVFSSRRETVPSSKGQQRRRTRTKPSGGSSSSNEKLNDQPKSMGDQRPQQRKQRMQQQNQIKKANTLGEAIRNAKSVTDHLSIVDDFLVWLPTDDNLPTHLRTQAIHHEKRRRWGGQWLEGLGHAALSSWDSLPMSDLIHSSLTNVWTDKRFIRVVYSVALPMTNNKREQEKGGTDDRPEKEGVWIATALKGLHVLSGCIVPVAPSSSIEMRLWLDLHRGISMLVRSADRLLGDERTPLKDSVEVRWAIRGLVTRLQIANTALMPTTFMKPSATLQENVGDAPPALKFTTPHLNTRTSNLPFDILPHCLSWQTPPMPSLVRPPNSPPNDYYYGYPKRPLLSTFLQEIPFHFDTLTTRTGNSVLERRGTAWLAEEGIGALAYSGKLMKPMAVPQVVREVMREVERWCVAQAPPSSSLIYEEDSSLQYSQRVALSSPSSEKLSWVEFVWGDFTSPDLPYRELGQFLDSAANLGNDFQNDLSYSSNMPVLSTFFDCVLCNHYPDGDSACKFHTDPEHGTHWHRTTAVVSCGASRKFAFRPIPGLSVWREWDGILGKRKDATGFDDARQRQMKEEMKCSPAVIQLFPGDVVLMTDACNDLFHHAVYPSSSDPRGGNHGCASANSRVSLVLKRALSRGGGKKGHGLIGEGRKARKKKRGLQ